MTKLDGLPDKSFMSLAAGRSRLLQVLSKRSFPITTDVCLLFPAIAAVQAGYGVYAVIDASGTWGAQAELASITRMAQAGVKMTNWVSVAAELLRDWSKPIGNNLVHDCTNS